MKEISYEGLRNLIRGTGMKVASGLYPGRRGENSFDLEERRKKKRGLGKKGLKSLIFISSGKGGLGKTSTKKGARDAASSRLFRE